MNFNKLISNLIEKLENKFADNFTGLILFGSYAKGTQKKTSDLDIFLTFKSLPKTRYERVNLIEDILNELEFKFNIAINPIITEEKELKLNFLLADISFYAKILIDKNNTLKSFFKKIKKEYDNNTIKKIESKNSYRLYVKNVY